jgi:hypothetical protein
MPDPLASGWNVYAGTTPDSMTAQTSQPLPVGSMWTYSGALKTDGKWIGSGQQPDYYVAYQQSVLRG